MYCLVNLKTLVKEKIKESKLLTPKNEKVKKNARVTTHYIYYVINMWKRHGASFTLKTKNFSKLLDFLKSIS